MIEFKQSDGDTYIECTGWDVFNGDDDALLGFIRKDKTDGYYWYMHCINNPPLSCAMMRDIARKISDLNIGKDEDDQTIQTT